ncbi:MAG: hypothetical protein IKP34_02330 [Bacteroidales bacterium]|nr:hypothetical protein [Bacteroidales bacterium]MBR4714995.1 hypothetical protein [Bacteroidales bacterium]
MLYVEGFFVKMRGSIDGHRQTFADVFRAEILAGWKPALRMPCQTHFCEKQPSEIVNNSPPEGAEKGQKWPNFNSLISRYHLPAKVYSNSYKILIKFYLGKV